MNMAQVARALRARWYVVIVVVIAAGAGALVARGSARPVSTGTATVQLLVDSPASALGDLRQDPMPLAERAGELAQAMTSGSVLSSIAAHAGVPSSELTAEGPYSGAGLGLNVETPSAARGVQLVAASSSYHLVFVPEASIPIITTSVVGPTPRAAGLVATAVVPGTEAWLATLQGGDTNPGARVTIRQLGAVQAGVVNSGSTKLVAAITGVGILLLGLLAVVGFEARGARRAGVAPGAPAAGAIRLTEPAIGGVSPEPVANGGSDAQSVGNRSRAGDTVTHPVSRGPIFTGTRTGTTGNP